MNYTAQSTAEQIVQSLRDYLADKVPFFDENKFDMEELELKLLLIADDAIYKADQEFRKMKYDA